MSKITDAATIVASNINNVVPSGPNYNGVSFLSGPVKQLVGNVLAVAQLGALVVVVFALFLYLGPKDENANRHKRWLIRGVIVLVVATLFNLIVTGGLGFISNLG